MLIHMFANVHIAVGFPDFFKRFSNYSVASNNTTYFRHKNKQRAMLGYRDKTIYIKFDSKSIEL